MQTVEEIQQAIEVLSSEDRGRLHDWMIECEDAWDGWDRQIVADIEAGRLDAFAHKAQEDKRRGLLRDLPGVERR